MSSTMGNEIKQKEFTIDLVIQILIMHDRYDGGIRKSIEVEKQTHYTFFLPPEENAHRQITCACESIG